MNFVRGRSKEPEARSQNFHKRRLRCFKADSVGQVIRGSCNITISCVEIAESWLEESRYYLILAQDLGYGQTDLLMNSLEEVSRPLNAYAQAFWLPAPDFWLPYPAAFWRDIKGAALARHKRE